MPSLIELDDLVNKIKKATNLNQMQIEIRCDYKPGYLSQVKARGSAPQKLIQKLKSVFEKELEGKMFLSDETIYEQIIKLRANSDVYGRLLTEVLARFRGVPLETLNEEVSTLLSHRLQKLKDELQS
jgi:hypothetical protein